jgi:8-oxo-dGTP diphosphatase
MEETGLRVKDILETYAGFDYQTPRKPKARQINFLVEVEPGDVILNPEEHDEFSWIREEDITDLHASEEVKICLRNILHNNEHSHTNKN